MHVERSFQHASVNRYGSPAPSPIWTAQQAAEDGGGLLEYWQLLWKEKFTFLVIATLFAVLALLISIPQAPVYQAATSIELQGFNENFLNLRSMSPTDPVVGAAAFDTYVQTQVEILRDHSLVHRVVEQLKLDENPEFVKPAVSWMSRLPLQKKVQASPTDIAVGRAIGGLTVRVSGQTRIVKISFDSTDPKIAADLANGLAEAYIQENLESRWKTNQKTGEWLQGQLANLRTRLKSSENELQRYAQDSGLLFTAEKNSVAEDRLRQLQDEMSKAQADRMAKQSQYEMAMSSKPESLPQTLNNATAREYQVKLTELRREYVDVSSLLSSTHYKVKRLDAQITEIQKALDRELSNTLRRIQNEYDSSVTREKLLTKEYNQQADLIIQKAPHAAHYNTLKREVDSTRAFHEAIVQQVQEAGIASAIRASNIRVIGRATPPTQPYKPNHTLNASLGLFAGMFFGFGFIVVRDKTNRMLRVPGDASMYLSVPELGAIPSADRTNVGSRSHFPRILGGGSDEPELSRWTRPGLVSESFRATIASIISRREGGSGPRVLLITSPGPKEGKTVVTGNLGMALAKSGRKVLIVDADFRRPRLSRMFDASEGQGLKDILVSDEQVEALNLRDYVKSTFVPTLDVLPAGCGATADPQFIQSSRLADALRAFRNQYDFIFIDAPPTLPVADARFLSRFTDGVVLVVRANKTSRDAATAAIARLFADTLPVLGVVLNDFDPRGSGAYGYDVEKHYFSNMNGEA